MFSMLFVVITVDPFTAAVIVLFAPFTIDVPATDTFNFGVKDALAAYKLPAFNLSGMLG
jgi:hypothetical protein